MIDVPPESAVHKPVAASIDAIVPDPDDHVPAGVALLSVAVAPWQSAMVPVMVEGSGLTVIIEVATQPLGNV